MTDLFQLLPRDIIREIIQHYPKRCWFLLCKRLNSVSFDGMDHNSQLRALKFASEHGNVRMIERCMKVRDRDYDYIGDGHLVDIKNLINTTELIVKLWQIHYSENTLQ